MLGILLQAGYEVTDNQKEADYIVVNTCGFLEASRKESVATINEAIGDRKKGAKVIVTGCMVQKHADELPKVDYLLGSGDVQGILRAVQSEEEGREITSARSFLEAGEVPRKISTPKHYAYLKIAEGCRKRCAYCVIPDIKGPLKSKSVEQVKKEFRTLLQSGVKEVILIAQDLGDFGKDQGHRKSDGLVLLLRELLKEPGNYWLRLLYLYPDEITEELIQLMKEDPRICRYLDIPIQHVNNTVLKNMRRKTSKEEIEGIIGLLRKELPEISIRTSLIVGFPGETDGEFKELLAFCKEYQLDNVGIFRYSREPGSAAAAFDGQISDEVKEERWHQLMQVQGKVVQKKLKTMVGKTIEVVVDGTHPESPYLLVGRHQGQCPEIDGQVIINDGRLVKSVGERYFVKVSAVAGYDLVGAVTGAVGGEPRKTGGTKLRIS